ncbi:MAG TPA: hypothetical protein VGB02_01295 [Pyrinomonadaceae bacterium]|jgi:deoxycytidine triphosphate deaminase
MYLLNDAMIAKYIEDDNGILDISDYLRKNLGHTFYYFRLGSDVTLNGKVLKLSEEERFLTLEPNDFAVIKTFERFSLSDNILGIFGQTRELAERGVQVLHSPFIDPRFKNRLILGIKNLGIEKIDLEYEVSKIGKVCFFNISDTYPINIKKNSDFYKRFIDSQE